MASRTTFVDEQRRVEQLIRRWQLGSAYQAARLLVNRHPTEPGSYLLLNLVICLTNGGPRQRGMHDQSQRLIQQAIRAVPGFQRSTSHGDMLRDLLFGLTRFPLGHRLELAHKLPDLIKRMHANDPNRLAALKDGNGRLAAADGDLSAACRFHASAHQDWLALQDPNVAWMYSNLSRWLRSSVELFGRRAPHTKDVLRAISDLDNQWVTRSGRSQITLLSMKGGVHVHHWMETHRLLF